MLAAATGEDDLTVGILITARRHVGPVIVEHLYALADDIGSMPTEVRGGYTREIYLGQLAAAQEQLPDERERTVTMRWIDEDGDVESIEIPRQARRLD
jgi:hypothetical protein